MNDLLSLLRQIFGLIRRGMRRWPDFAIGHRHRPITAMCTDGELECVCRAERESWPCQEWVAAHLRSRLTA